jgi:DNA sulfur modification protein DndB
MKKIALRFLMGDWAYYMTALTFKEVLDNISAVVDEMGDIVASDKNKEVLQKDLSMSRVDEIVNYIKTQKEMFFNSLVLAIYNGDPAWRMTVLEYPDIEGEIENAGILEIDPATTKIFPVNGQDKVEAIKKLMLENDSKQYEDQTIPAIFVAHVNTPAGKKRTKRLFTTLNGHLN